MQTIVIGKILKPQGIRGELKVAPITDDAARFARVKSIFLEGEAAPRKVFSVRVSPEAVYMVLEGVLDRNGAELLRGKTLAVARTEAVPLEEGRYFISEIIGCAVATPAGETFGTITDVLQHGAADVYVMKGSKGEILFPALADVILSVDVKAKKMTVDAKRFAEVACYED